MQAIFLFHLFHFLVIFQDIEFEIDGDFDKRTLYGYIPDLGGKMLQLDVSNYSIDTNGDVVIDSEKYTVFPCPSVSLPSSKICKNLSKIDGWAFSISSNNTIE